MFNELKKLIEEVGNVEDVEMIIPAEHYYPLKSFLERLISTLRKFDGKICYVRVKNFMITRDDVIVNTYEECVVRYSHTTYSLKQILEEAVKVKEANNKSRILLNELQKLLI